MGEGLLQSTLEARFNSLIDEHGSLLRNTIARLCPKDLGIQFDDIEQEARLRLWRGIESEREIRDSASYIYRIAVTTTIDAIRQAKSRREDQFPTAGIDEFPVTTGRAEAPDREASHRLLIERIERILNSFSERRRLAVGLHLQGMTTREIAEMLNWTEPKARNLLHRGLKDLRKRLREEGIDYEVR